MRTSVKQKLLKKYTLIASLVIFFVIFVYSQKDENISSEKLMEMVGKVYVLPTNEKPTVATVTNLEPLKGSLFFKNAEVGDKVIIYSIEGKAILFRPKENKVVEVGPLNFNIKK